nr:hypothetical protein [Halalkalibacter alkaliphilus]
MLAKYENPDSDILYLPYFNQSSDNPSQYNTISQNAYMIEDAKSINQVIQRVNKVYTFSSLIGFKAILNDIKVVTFGTPFYAGWGLTEDRVSIENRNLTLTKEALFASYCLLNSKYIHPFKHEEIEIEELVNLISISQLVNRKAKSTEDSNPDSIKDEVFLLGFDSEKQELMRNYLSENEVINIDKNQGLGKFRKLLDSTPKGKAIIWTGENTEKSLGVDNTPKLIDIVLQKEYSKVYVDNGLINYNKYNKKLLSPFSIVLDKEDQPYRNNTKTKLNALLNSYDEANNDNLLERADNLITQLRSNIDTSCNHDLELLFTTDSEGVKRSVVLVLGVNNAVINDYSVGDNISSLDLIWIAKLENPEAHIIFKAGDENFESDELLETINKLATIVEEQTDISEFISVVDKVYTKDSPNALVALVADKTVITFGSPFYAGWGLTEDRKKIENRSRTLSIKELVGVSLIKYPLYINPFTKDKIEVEESVLLQEKVGSIESKYDISLMKKSETEGDDTSRSSNNHYYDLKEDLETKKVGIVSPGLKKMANLDKLLPAEVVFDPAGDQIEELDYVGGWGLKPGYKDARVFAEKHGVPYLAMEDGFLRSVGLGVDGAPSLSFSLDDVGVYYDASKPSRLENILNSTGWETKELIDDAKKAIQLIKENYLSKYNTGRIMDPSEFRQNGRKRVLVVDQTLGDMSIALGLGSQQSFINMFYKAKQENPGADIYVKVHPDVIAGKKQGNIQNLKEDEHTIILSEGTNPLSLLENMDAVYVVTSQMGFEALLLGKEVHCFGMPFYAGWGITHDELNLDRRTKNRSLEELFAASYMLYCTYLNPKTGKRGTIFDVIDHILENK